MLTVPSKQYINKLIKKGKKTTGDLFCNFNLCIPAQESFFCQRPYANISFIIVLPLKSCKSKDGFMKKFCRLVILFSLLAMMHSGHANVREQNAYRDFWSPTYHGQRLAYCTLNGKKCGAAVADCYCRKMGYQRASTQIMEHNVGISNYLNSRAQCQGWRCNGFKLIQCVGVVKHQPPAKYHYRSRRFAAPRIGHYRVDWCYENSKGCGQRAAYSFCRRMGYLKAQEYKKAPHLPATKALGNQRLCFGNECEGFSYITCYR